MERRKLKFLSQRGGKHAGFDGDLPDDPDKRKNKSDDLHKSVEIKLSFGNAVGEFTTPTRFPSLTKIMFFLRLSLL
jgi:hypothetical protein